MIFETKTEHPDNNLAMGNPMGQSSRVLQPVSQPVARRASLPLVLVGFLAVGSAAYFLGRISSAPYAGSALPGATTAPEVESTKETSSEKKAAGTEHGGLIELEADAVKTADIRVETAHMVPISVGINIPGTVEVGQNQSAKITPPVPGKVVRLMANVGQVVSAGQTLAVLDSVEVAEAHAAVRQAESGVQQAMASLQTARAGVEQAQTALQSAEMALRGQQRLVKAGVFSQPSLQAARAAVADAESELLLAQTEAQSHTTVLARAERLFKDQLVARAELEQAQAEQRQDATRVAQAQARVNSARETMAREKRLAQGGLLSRQALLTNEAEVRTARGAVLRAIQEEQAARTALNTARSSVSTARTNLEAAEGNGHREGTGGRLSLYAPISGTVTGRNVTLGEAVERTATLFVIENLQTVLVIASVPEQEVSRVQTGQQVEVLVAAYPRERFSGVVQSIGSRVDEKTRALPVRVLVQNPGGRLKPDMYARVALATGGSVRVLAVPDAAVDEDGDERFVYVAVDGGYEKREVTTGKTSNGMTEIIAGIKDKEKVVTEGMFVLKSESKKDELKEEE